MANLKKLIGVRLEWKDGKMTEIPDSEFEMKADLVFLAMGSCITCTADSGMVLAWKRILEGMREQV
jgi:NADPH-dependent glutamate synthase beta subunit-like oxidoreductase